MTAIRGDLAVVSAVPVRRLLLCAVVGALFASCLPAWADGEADQVARARQLFDGKNYNEAIAILVPITTSSVKADSKASREVLVDCYRLAGKFDKALSLLGALRQEYPEDTSTWLVRLGCCHREKGDYSKAIEALKEALTFTSRPAGITAALADNLYACYIETDAWESGVSLCRSALEKEPQNATEWTFLLGRCYRRLGKYPEAIANLEKAIEAAKKDQESVVRMVSYLCPAFQESGQFDKAEAFLVKLDQDYPAYHSHWQSELVGCQRSQARWLLQEGYDLQRQGHYAKAIAAFKNEIDRFPSFEGMAESAHVCIVECLHSLGKTDEATAYAKKLYDEQPAMRAGALFAQGLLSCYSKDYDAAAALFRRVMSEYPKDRHAPLARSCLVPVLRKAGRFDEALEVLGESPDTERNAEQSDPEMKARRILQIADIYYEAKKYREAIKAFKEVRNLKDAPAEMKAEATYRSGLCYHEIGYGQSARKCIDEVIKVHPDSAWARSARRALYLWVE